MIEPTHLNYRYAHDDHSNDNSNVDFRSHSPSIVAIVVPVYLVWKERGRKRGKVEGRERER